ncbi:M50 family metallopeptidase [Falsibacillus albus]|uniref:Stage IV sporulation protein FB n=1 Tax=Falsibacillus albus TaxID=2478915 RepID=A0A3L7K632_9BACI|nr:M50 family metallopeptidase [Falsibacillus albus]RLQ98065.1 stage IV sporulation protein FB [Falsibacillus albus]
MNNMMSLFKKIRIHPLFWVIAAIAVMTAHFMELFILVLIIMVHEMGHGVMAHFFSWRIKKIVLLPFGGVAEMDEHGNRPLKEEWLVILAGPIQHIWMALLMYFLNNEGAVSESSFALFMNFNMMVLLFNLMPIWPLDGGKLLLLFFSTFQPFSAAFNRVLIISLIIMILLHGSVMFIFPFQLNLWIVMTYLYFSLWKEWKHKRFVFMRFLLERYYGKKTAFRKLKPLIVDGEEFLSHVLERFQRGAKHPIIVHKDGVEIGKLDENEVLHAYFAEKKVSIKIKDLMYID